MNKRAIILVVDDASANLAMCKGLLSNEYEVHLARSGRLALKAMEKIRPDVILLDIEMPEMSGFDVMDAFNKDPDFHDIPVIFVTSHATDILVKKAFDYGVADYVVKPFDATVLRAKILSALLRQSNQENVVQV